MCMNPDLQPFTVPDLGLPSKRIMSVAGGAL